MHSSTQTIQQIQCWLENLIIEHNFCPFAKQVFVKDSIRYTIADISKQTTPLESSLHSLAHELKHLDRFSETETTLLIFPQAFQDFDDFLELIDLADALIDELSYRGTYQLAHFHPNYCFAGEAEDDAANFTNRAPFPVLHLLRESSLEKAIEQHPDPASIPEQNIKLAREIGFDRMQSLLDNCLNNTAKS